MYKFNMELQYISSQLHLGKNITIFLKKISILGKSQRFSLETLVRDEMMTKDKI